MPELFAMAPDERFEIDPEFLLQWEPAQQAYVLLYPEGIIKLNQTAAEILKRCTGRASVADIVTQLKQVFTDAGPDGQIERSVCAFLEVASGKGWIRSSHG